MNMIKERIGKLLEDISICIYPQKKKITEYSVCRVESGLIDIQTIDPAIFQPFDIRQGWGGNGEYFLFATTIIIPEDFNDRTVIYRLSTGLEGQWDAVNPQFRVYVNGYLKQGLDVNHREVLLTGNAVAGEEYTLLLLAFTGEEKYFIQLDSEICILDKRTQQYYYDVLVPYQTVCLLDEKEKTAVETLKALNESLNLLDLRRSGTKEYYDSLKKAQGFINSQFYDKLCGKQEEGLVYCVGHTHIDCAWLWTTAITKDKVIRSFSTVIELMKRYPEYRFMSSQPLLYQYVKEYAPDLYRQIKARIEEGRWEPDGGMYVEADCNLISGESMARQFLYGQKFFQEEFDKVSKVLWLPDVFGYSPALPQIMKKCGIEYFMTTKLNWNETNQFPYDTFIWEGMDGSKILSHLIPTKDYKKMPNEGNFEPEYFTTYNGVLNPSQVKGAWHRYGQKELGEKVLMAYGFGDGGGGPTPEMLEHQRRLQKGIPGCPTTIQSGVMEFFTALRKEVEDNQKYLHKWSGELYFENHRGTYTSMGIVKKLNRKAEFLLAKVEYLSTMNYALNKIEYPKKQLEEAWLLLLKNQFHDIIPGSSIYEVYEETLQDYEELFRSTKDLEEKALQTIVQNIYSPAGSYVFFNPNGFPADGRIEIENVQGKEVYEVTNIPPKGYLAVIKEELHPMDKNVWIKENSMENPYLVLEWNKKGQIIRLYDKRTARNLIRKGEAANVLMTYEDRPHCYDAWNINHYYKEKAWEIDDIQSITVVEDNGYTASIRISRRYLDSTIEQYITMYSNKARIDIRNVIDWKEHNILLRALFPVDIHANEATYDVAFGNIKRPANFNTSWDRAKFEVCAHKWMDFSEGNYGISILNDGKYGCDVHDGVLGLTLLKSAIYPNPMADKQVHEFTYSLLPHIGSLNESETVKEAYLLNNPVFVQKKEKESGLLLNRYSFVSSDAENIMIETIKKAEITDDQVILRFYEFQNKRQIVTLTFAHEIIEASECDMLEREERELLCQGNQLQLYVGCYEVKTIKVKLLFAFN
ncbi:alpha-mannosidase [Lacrimispora sp.]|uniref:alpha-mannosidase n=1 Tax=Lacrimispora sp. TaxID=2719234 RepID=UPI0028AC3494|nr:alpha-mannosidase [Lacrimispora sp.]